MDAAAEAGTGGATIAPRLAAFALWWRDELAGMLPAPLLARLGRRPAAIDCVLLADGRALLAAGAAGGGTPAPETVEIPGEAGFAARLEGLLATGRRDTVRLSVPRGHCLLRTVELPRSALAHAGALLRYEIEALLPDPPEDILSDWYVELEDRAGDRLFLRQVVLLRPRIAAIEAAIEAAGGRLARITVGDGEGRPVPVDLLNERRPALAARLRALPRAAQALGLLAALLLAGTLLALAGRPEATLEALARERAAFARPTPLAQSAAGMADFLDARRQTPGAARLLDEVAARLPPGAHLRSLALSPGGTLVLGVAGPGAPEAGGLLAASPFFASHETLSATAEETTLLLRLAAPAGDAP